DVPSIVETADSCRLWNIVQRDFSCTCPRRIRSRDNYVLERRTCHYFCAVGIGHARRLIDSDLLSIVRVDDRQPWTAGALRAFSAVLADFLADIDEDFTWNKALLLDNLGSLGPFSPVERYPTLLVSNLYLRTRFFASLV